MCAFFFPFPSITPSLTRLCSVLRGRLWDDPAVPRSPTKVLPHRVAPKVPSSSHSANSAMGGVAAKRNLATASQPEKRPLSARVATQSPAGDTLFAKLIESSVSEAKGSLAARIALASSVGGKGFKSIADIAKPSMKAGVARKLITATPLDAAMTITTLQLYRTSVDHSVQLKPIKRKYRNPASLSLLACA